MVLEDAVVVAEIADFAWQRYSKGGEARAKVCLLEREVLSAENARVHEEFENQRLRAVLDEYRNALFELQERVSAVDWLRHELSTEDGTLDVFDRVQERVNSAEFLSLIQLPPEVRNQSDCETTTRYTDKDGLEVTVDVSDESWWTWIDDKDLVKPTEDRDPLDGGGYVLVDREDVIDAVANFVARYLTAHPDTQEMSPKEIQEAISTTFDELKTKNTVRKLWQWGKFLYTTSSWLATAVNIYKHPLIVRATLMAIWTSSRVILGMTR